MKDSLHWWECGLIGGIILSFFTAINVVRALFGGVDLVGLWGEVLALGVAVFFMGLLCGVIAWSGKGLHRRFGAVGDALVGIVVLLTFFICCMLLFAPDLLGPKLHDGGLLMLGFAGLLGAVGGIWFGHDIDDETSPPGT